VRDNVQSNWEASAVVDPESGQYDRGDNSGEPSCWKSNIVRVCVMYIVFFSLYIRLPHSLVAWLLLHMFQAVFYEP